MKKKLMTSAVLITFFVLSVWYIHHTFFFSPLSFEQDDITYQSWTDYQRPMTLTYYDLDGGRTSYQIEGDEEIRSFFKAMKQCPSSAEGNEGEQVLGALRISSARDIVLEAYFYNDFWHVLQKDHERLEITQKLEGLINQL
ncbi:hypothetical protein [Halobacillus litoralis]|uniref:hypothetical protein n=1 Tax=Halobacillus litoralis TaxID=45668 RepID=UPI001CD1DC71|nr:hypothetical protein [Halobacillus litoralis]MCA1024073.1 hypothetical protein [Halobacillus litoralis]